MTLSVAGRCTPRRGEVEADRRARVEPGCARTEGETPVVSRGGVDDSPVPGRAPAPGSRR